MFEIPSLRLSSISNKDVRGTLCEWKQSEGE